MGDLSRCCSKVTIQKKASIAATCLAEVQSQLGSSFANSGLKLSLPVGDERKTQGRRREPQKLSSLNGAV
jgi:hypothetical protein